MKSTNIQLRYCLALFLSLFLLLPVIYASANAGKAISIYSDQDISTAVFATNKLKSHLQTKGFVVRTANLEELKKNLRKNESRYVLLNQKHPEYTKYASGVSKKVPEQLKAEGFVLERNKNQTLIAGADDTGLLYGVYELIERMEMDNIGTNTSMVSEPKFAFRGIKFNLPWSTYRVHESLSLHHETCRDLQFWERFLDMMSENRFNYLTLWAIHPWTYMVKPTDYPEASGLTEQELAEWQDFWRSLFAMAKERGVKVLMVNWNIFVSPEFAKAHNVAIYSTELSSGYNGKGDYSQLVQDYNRDVVRQVLKEYPELNGLGISQNERMEGRTDEDWQNWIADTYFDVISEAEGTRELMMRGHTHPSPELTRRAIEKNRHKFKGPVWISLKFNWSHSFASPKLFYIHGGSTSDALWNPYPEDYKVLFKIRNEDFFILRWGQPDYVRELLKENSQSYIDGFTIGSETYIPAKEYTTKPGSHLTWDYGFEKQWLFYKLWGRLMYNPETSNKVFEHTFDKKYGIGTGSPLLAASSKAGNMPLRLATYYSSSWDFTLYSEGFISGATQSWRGQYYDKTSAFISIEEIIHSKTLDPSWMNIREYVEMMNNDFELSPSRLSPLQLATKLEEDGNEALNILNSIKTSNPTLSHEIADQKAWAYLSLYFSSKLKAGIDLQFYRTSSDVEKQKSALKHITQAAEYWEMLCQSTDPYAKEIPLLHLGDDYITTKFTKMVDKFSWRAFSDQVQRDIQIVKKCSQEAVLDLLQMNPKIESATVSAKAVLQQDPFQISIKAIDNQPVVDVGVFFDLAPKMLLPYKYVYTEVFNHSQEEVLVIVRLGGDKWAVGGEVIAPNSKGLIQTPIYRDVLPKNIDTAFFGMNGLPGGILKLGGNFDPASINNINVVLPVGKTGQEISITKIYASELIDFNLPSVKAFFPFIDEFGQYKHGHYYGKIKSREDMMLHSDQEKKDLEENPAPKSWDRYGGWKEGPKMEVSQHFKTVKYNGKWWLVTPDGHLFWSHGINCVGMGSSTPITDRVHYFDTLPAKNLINGNLYTQRENAPKGYYQGIKYELVDFYKWNLYRKYGDNYVEKFANDTHKRLASWGMNTIGNWSDKEIYLQGKTPYTVRLSTESVPIAGTSGQWRKFPDPFHPLFEQNLIKSMEEQVQQNTVDDPMCIGYFVDNELSWGGKTYLAEGMLLSGKDQPAKQHWLQYLKSKYKSIKAINYAWGANFKNWQEVERISVKSKGIENDLEAFNRLIAEKYFSSIKDILNKYAPNKLYLGCRFDFHFYPTEDKHGAWVIEVAAKHCDVISFNRYRYSAEDLYYHATNIDKPIIIGEMHFNSLDGGLLHSGLRGVKDQAQRKRMYEYYYKSALQNPFIVGVHWFQFVDQLASGRFDGENYQAGFINIVDVPHPESVEASRNIGSEMYQIRIEASTIK